MVTRRVLSSPSLSRRSRSLAHLVVATGLVAASGCGEAASELAASALPSTHHVAADDDTMPTSAWVPRLTDEAPFADERWALVRQEAEARMTPRSFAVLGGASDEPSTLAARWGAIFLAPEPPARGAASHATTVDETDDAAPRAAEPPAPSESAFLHVGHYRSPLTDLVLDAEGTATLEVRGRRGHGRWSLAGNVVELAMDRGETVHFMAHDDRLISGNGWVLERVGLERASGIYDLVAETSFGAASYPHDDVTP